MNEYHLIKKIENNLHHPVRGSIFSREDRIAEGIAFTAD